MDDGFVFQYDQHTITIEKSDERGPGEYTISFADSGCGRLDSRRFTVCPGPVSKLLADCCIFWKEPESSGRIIALADAAHRHGDPEYEKCSIAIRRFVEFRKDIRSVHITGIKDGEPCDELMKVLSSLTMLEYISVEENDHGYYTENGILYRSEKISGNSDEYVTIVKCPPAYPVQRVCPSRRIDAVEEKAFCRVCGVTEVSFDGCRNIGHQAFFCAEDLETVILKAEKINIRYGAFFGCRKIKKTDINAENILSCNLEDIHLFRNTLYKELLAEWIKKSGCIETPENVIVFGKCGENVWRYLNIFGTEHVIGRGDIWDFSEKEHCLNPLFGESTLIIHGGIKTIGEEAFSECDYGTIIIENGVRNIHGGAFWEGGCENIAFPRSVEYIGTMLFATDPCRVRRITISAETEKIAAGAFYWRLYGPFEVVLTGGVPSDWIMWLRSDLFAWIDENTKIFFPEKWLDTITPEYLHELRKKMEDEKGWPECSDEGSFFDLDPQLRVDFVDELEQSIYGRSEDREPVFFTY